MARIWLVLDDHRVSHIGIARHLGPSSRSFAAGRSLSAHRRGGSFWLVCGHGEPTFRGRQSTTSLEWLSVQGEVKDLTNREREIITPFHIVATGSDLCRLGLLRYRLIEIGLFTSPLASNAPSDWPRPMWEEDRRTLLPVPNVA